MAFARNFGYNLIEWDIKNFVYKVITEDFVIVSPEFYIRGSSTTKWKMMLYPKLKHKEIFVFSTNLERLHEPGPTNVSFSSKVLIQDEKGKESFATYHEDSVSFSFSTREISCYSVNFLLQHFQVNELESVNLKIVCYLLVRDDNQMIDECFDTGLRLLSYDLKKILETAAESDFTIKTEYGKQIFCHKAVLRARSSMFDSFLNETSYKTFDIRNSNYEIMRCILNYIYSGNIEVIANNASVKMHELLLFMGLRSMKAYFQVDRSRFLSQIEKESFWFCWEINSREIISNCFFSQIVKPKNLASRWKLTFYFDGLDKLRKYVSITADMVQGSVPDNCVVTFVLREENGVLSRRSQPLNKDRHVGFLNFISRDSFETKIKKYDKLLVDFILDIHSCNVNTSNIYTCLEPKTNLPRDYFYNCLSDDLARILERVSETDTLVKVIGTDVVVHKCILAARSPALISMITEKNMEHLKYLKLMNESVLQRVLYYIYSGKFDNCEEQEILSVYTAAKVFYLADLKEKCLEKMQRLLTFRTAVPTFVVSCKEEDEELKSIVMNFIRRNLAKVQENNSWNQLSIQNPRLYYDILKNLQQ